MTIISQIEDRGAAVAWSPISSHADLLALGTKDSGGIGFDDYGGELEIYDMNITSSSGGTATPQLLGSVKTTSRFASIGWTPLPPDMQIQFPMGLIAGGMVDGTIIIWDPSLMLKGEGTESQIVSITNHSGGGAVTALAFNPHPSSANELASGDASGQVFITSLSNPTSPETSPPSDTNTQQGGEITRVAWNSQVSHIVAAAGGNGIVVVYDTKQKKPWCEIRSEPNGSAVADMAWNPSEGLHLITASADDRNPVMKLWDLRASTSMPLATLQGHTQGILGFGWCPHDATLLVSCGKDNRTLLWDLFSLQPIYEIPNVDGETDAPANPANIYGGGLGNSQHKRYDVQWSPLRRGVISTCSFDRRVQAHSMIGAATKSGRTPKWLKRPCGVSTGFGGSVASFASHHRTVTIETVVEEPELKSLSESFEKSIASNDFVSFCAEKANDATSQNDIAEAKIWSFMQIIFAPNAREQLLHYLGFDPQKVSEMAQEFSEEKTVESFESLSLEEKSKMTPAMSKEAEDAVKQALVVGNFEAAVECCFKSGNLADALVLSSCGGAELWSKTQARYFELEAQKRPYLSIVSAVIHNKLDDLVASSDPAHWQETLAIVSTYGKSEDFAPLCLALGERLESMGDAASASLCFMCASNLDRAAKYWKEELEAASSNTSGAVDIKALHSFVERVAIFLQAVDPNTPLEPGTAKAFSEYAQILSQQGLLVMAAKYCKAETQECNQLRDRLYYSRYSQACRQYIRSPPSNPFARKNVGVAPAASQQQPQQQQYGAAKTATRTGAATNPYQQQQQQPQQQQQGQYYQQTAQQQQPQPPQNDPNQLPPGWIALQDPSSGMTYYANTTTGETSWEKPAPVQQLNPTPPVVPPQNQQPAQTSYATSNGSFGHQASEQPQQTTSAPTANKSSPSGTTPSGNAKLVSKYGDGFVTSASHPELAEQYGNIGTSNPYTGVQRPGTAADPIVKKTTASPPSGNFDPSNPPALSPELQPIADSLLNFVNTLAACQLTSSEQKQCAEIQKAVGVLIKKLSKNLVDDTVTDKVKNIVAAVMQKNYAAAGAIQTGLVNSDWREHKDWLKGMKFLIQLGARQGI